MNKLHCKKCREDLMRRFDHSTNDMETEALKLHLKSCQSCREFYADLNEILGAVEAVIPIEPGPDIEIKVLEQINTLKSSGSSNDGFINTIKYILPFAFTVLILMGLYFQNISIFQWVKGVSQYFRIIFDGALFFRDIIALVSKFEAVSLLFRQIQYFYLAALFMAGFLVIEICAKLAKERE